MTARFTLSVRGPSSPIVKLASARSRRSALLRPRCARLTALIVPLSSAVWCPRARERTGRSKAVNTSRATSRESEGASLLVFSCPWSARPEPALWLKRHGKRPGGSLFPLGSVLGWPSRSCRRGCVERLRSRPYRWRRRHLRTAARPLSQLVGRRPLPPAILAIGQQTGRERPRPWFAMVVPGRSRGRSRPVCWCFCHRSCGLQGARRHDSQAHAEKTRHPPRR
jgi:hypothetical protein